MMKQEKKMSTYQNAAMLTLYGLPKSQLLDIQKKLDARLAKKTVSKAEYALVSQWIADAIKKAA
jgi:hypothetical protein